MSASYKLTHPTIQAALRRLRIRGATVSDISFCTDLGINGTRQAVGWLESNGFVECTNHVSRGNHKTKIYHLTPAGLL